MNRLRKVLIILLGASVLQGCDGIQELKDKLPEIEQKVAEITNILQAGNSKLDGLSDKVDSVSKQIEKCCANRQPIDHLPFVIMDCGSYFVTRCLTSEAGGIRIQANNVTLDLNGFTISGVPNVDQIGIEVFGNNVKVSNGVVRGWNLGGIRGGTSTQLDDLRLTDNGRSGLIGCDNCTVTRVHSFNNRGHGLSVRVNSTVDGCMVSRNDGDGIQATLGNVITNNNVSVNKQHGIHLTDTGGAVVDGSRVDGNSVSANGGAGVAVDASISGKSVIVRNTAHGNHPNYDIAPGSDVGPIGSAAASTSPWANIEF